MLFSRNLHVITPNLARRLRFQGCAPCSKQGFSCQNLDWNKVTLHVVYSKVVVLSLRAIKVKNKFHINMFVNKSMISFRVYIWGCCCWWCTEWPIFWLPNWSAFNCKLSKLVPSLVLGPPPCLFQSWSVRYWRVGWVGGGPTPGGGRGIKQRYREIDIDIDHYMENDIDISCLFSTLELEWMCFTGGLLL